MRNQQTSIFKVNAFSPQIEPLCRDSEASSPFIDKVASDRKKASMCITASNRGNEKANTCHAPSKSSSGPGQSCFDCHQDPCKDKLMLPQPLFMLEKKERPFKRHASDLVLKAEYGICMYPEKRVRSSSFTFQPSYSPPHKGDGVSEKRVRSCSFTLQPAFPPSQPALKNNVFMPSSLLQEHPKTSTTSLGSLQNWNVIKPATLQPPNVSLCQTEKPAVGGSEITSDQPKHKLEKSNMATDNTNKSKNALGPTCILDIKNRSQPFEQLSVLDKNTSGFVFGVDIEKRVMSAQRSELSPASAFQCKWEDTSSRLHPSLRKPYPDTNRSLMESAAAYSSKPRVKYELDQVEIITGEESERNVLQMNCKLFVLNIATQTWTERGRGYLRLNDTAGNENGIFRSRIVMRNYGSLKLIFNSMIFDQMKVERANRKSLRITAADLKDNSIKVFLIQASVRDAGRLHAAIHHRLVALRSYRGKEQQLLSTESETNTNSYQSDSDSEDEEEEIAMFPSNISDHHQWIRRQPVLYS